MIIFDENGGISYDNWSPRVLVETFVCNESGFFGEEYKAVDAEIVTSASEEWFAQMVMKVKDQFLLN